jgi:AbrB family looped-hinge helix DNA binding protein
LPGWIVSSQLWKRSITCARSAPVSSRFPQTTAKSSAKQMGSALSYKLFLPYFLFLPTSTESAYVTSKGQVVVPARLRRKLGIKAGTRLNFSLEAGRLVVQPVTREFIDSYCGIFKSKSEEKSAVQELLDDRAGERAREDREIAADKRK